MKTFFETKTFPGCISEKEKIRFEENKKAKFFIPGIHPLKNVWLTYSGICLKPYHIYRGSVYWKAYPIFRYFLQGLYNLLTKKKIRIPGEAIFIHTPWSVVNYHHWLVDSLPRLYVLQKENKQKLILPVALKAVPFVTESLDIFGPFDITYMEPSQILNLAYTRLVDISPGKYFITSDLKPTIAKLKERLAGKENVNRKIYLTRRNVGYRMLVNEKEVSELLLSRGFEVIEADRFSFKEQVKIFSETKMLVAIHGAALTNCIFMPEGSSVIELHPDIERTGSIFNVCYHNLSHYFGLKYHFQGCKPVNEKERFHTADLVADLDKLKGLLGLCMGSDKLADSTTDSKK